MSEETQEVQETPVAEVSAEAEPEKTPLHHFLDDFETLKAKVVGLEQALTSHGHGLDQTAIVQIASLVVQQINAELRAHQEVRATMNQNQPAQTAQP